jgi:hypothetical protein
LRQLEFVDHYDIHHVVSFELIKSRSALPVSLLEKADLFIYQPLSSKYGMYASDSIQAMLSDQCRRISFPYVYNDAMWPFAPSGSGPKGQEILQNMHSMGWRVEEIIYAFCSLSLDCEFERRFESSLAILRSHEQATTVKAADYILNGISEKKMFLTQSHPTSHVFVHCVNQILSLLGHDPLPSSQPFSLNEAGLPQQWPITPYEMEHYDFTYVDQCEPGWEEFYSNEIRKFMIGASKEGVNHPGDTSI